MNKLFQSVRALFGQNTIASEWQPVDDLQKAIDEQKVAQFELNKAVEEYDIINGDYALKFKACDVLIEKGEKIGEQNKLFLTQRLDGITDRFLNNGKQLGEALKKATQLRVQLESDIIAKAVQLTAQLDQQDQSIIKDMIDVWQETGLIKGEQVESQAKAIILAIEEIVKGGVGSGRKKYRYKDMAGNIKVFHADSESDAKRQAERHFRGNKFITHEVSDEKNELEKGGEGSRGGKVIGHTKSGKPVYAKRYADEYDDFDSKDHHDAEQLHNEESDYQYRVKSNKRLADHHSSVSNSHASKLKKGEDIKKSHEPIAIELAGRGDVIYDSPVEGHYANVIIKDKDGKILFLKRAANKVVESNKFCLPGGHIDEGETVEQAACRELKEEANIDCNSCYIIGKAKCDDGKWAFYLGAYPQFNNVALLDGESVNAHWMSRDEWIEADLIFDLKEHLVAIETSSQSIDKIPNILKKGEDEVEMPWKEFIKEHKRLLDVLENGTEEECRAEAKRQRKEMAKYEGGREIEKAIDDNNPFYYDNQEELIKGRAAGEGEERTWGGKKYKKVGGKWVLVGSGKEKGSDEILGKTKSGKAIYNDASHEEHKNFSIKEHREASSAHVEKYKQLKDSDKKKAEHHLDQSIEHRKAADKKETDQYKPTPTGIKKKEESKQHSTDQLTKHAENTSSDQLKKIADNKDHPHNDAAKRELERRAGEEAKKESDAKAEQEKWLVPHEKRFNNLLKVSDNKYSIDKIESIEMTPKGNYFINMHDRGTVSISGSAIQRDVMDGLAEKYGFKIHE